MGELIYQKRVPCFTYTSVVAQQPIDDFMCLAELAMGRSLDIMCVVKSLSKPDVQVWRMYSVLHDREPT